LLEKPSPSGWLFFWLKMNLLKRAASVPADIQSPVPAAQHGRDGTSRRFGNLKDEGVLSYNQDLSPTF
jgi:hypothetical protein